MPSFEVRNVNSIGIEVQNISAEALTIKEHGGEDWHTATPRATVDKTVRQDTAELPEVAKPYADHVEGSR